MRFVCEKRDGDQWWDANNMRGGNLAAIADLTFLKKFHAKDVPITRPKYTGPCNTVLYIEGDSYTWSLRDTNFAGIAGYHFLDRYRGAFYHLDRTKRNILVIAISEGWVRQYFRRLRMLDEIRDTARHTAAMSSLYKQEPLTHTQQATLVSWPGISMFFNKNIEQNLRCNLFNYNFMHIIFEFKGAINYYLFRRASGDVVISDDGNYLFHRNTVSHTDTGSSYVPLTPGEKDLLVENINHIYDHYKAQGFSEVYLSMIPNTASLMQPHGYNDLIPLIQNDPALRMKIIDVYYTFKKSSEDLFFHGDTHWNPMGKQKWVDAVNTIIENNNK